MISEETIEKIKSSVRLVDVVAETVALKRRGSNFVGLCPFHGENSPSFHVHENENFYHCFGCGESGNVISWFMKSQGLSFPEAINTIGERYGIEIVRIGKKKAKSKKVDTAAFYALNQIALDYFQEQLRTAPADVQSYLTGRSVDSAVQEYFAVGYVPDGWRGLIEFCRSKSISDAVLVESGLARRNAKGELYDTFRGRIMFPVWVDSKRIAGFGGRALPSQNGASDAEGPMVPKYINSPESPVYHKSAILYGLPQALSTIRASKEVIVVEGYLDVISLHRVGVSNAVATCGTALTKDHVKRLSSLVTKVLLLFDGDKAGRAAAAKSFVTFINSGLDVQVLFLADGEDPDSIAVRHEQATADYLHKQSRQTLLHCWIHALVEKNGFESIAAMGAAAKGKICTTVADNLRAVVNKIERKQLVVEASFLLAITKEELLALVNKQPLATVRLHVEEEQKEETLLTNPSIADLKVFERELLYAVMAAWDRLPQQIIEESFLMAELHPAISNFIENLASIAADTTQGVDERKAKIKALLQECGGSWIEHWKRAHKVKDDRAVIPENIIHGCVEALRRERANKALAAVEAQIAQCDDEDMRAELIQQKITLLRPANTGLARVG